MAAGRQSQHGWTAARCPWGPSAGAPPPRKTPADPRGPACWGGHGGCEAQRGGGGLGGRAKQQVALSLLCNRGQVSRAALAGGPPGSPSPPCGAQTQAALPSAPSLLREQWIRAKYERQEFTDPERQEPYSAGKAAAPRGARPCPSPFAPRPRLPGCRAVRNCTGAHRFERRPHGPWASSLRPRAGVPAAGSRA